jgi:hypothetical protein
MFLWYVLFPVSEHFPVTLHESRLKFGRNGSYHIENILSRNDQAPGLPGFISLKIQKIKARR